MAEIYRFDPRAVIAEMSAIVAWCETNGLVAKEVPVDARVEIDGPWLKVEHYVFNGGRIVIEHDEVKRTMRVVPLIVRPDFASLKPVEQGEGGARCPE